jgi:hypothetical protein
MVRKGTQNYGKKTILTFLQIDKVLSGLEEFEITKIYCLVFTDAMRDRMPSCNHSGGVQLTSSLAIMALTAFIL